MCNKEENITKRSFLKKLTGLGGMLLGFGIGKNSFVKFNNFIDEQQSELPPMPMVQFGDYKISKLVIGSNPMEGVSHFSRDMNNVMKEYASDENLLELFRMCEELGINTWQSHGTDQFMNLLDIHRKQKGKFKWIVSSSVRTVEEFPKNLKWLMSRKPIAFDNWGVSTDFYWNRGEIDKIKDIPKMIRDEGVLVGMCSHIPEALEYMEEKDWDVDFYMACFYYPSKMRDKMRGKIDEKTGKPVRVGEYYGKEDREKMCKFIRQTKKFCLGYKILAASRNATTPEDTRNAFEYALKNIKKNDAVVVGMFLPYHVRDNTKYVKEIWHNL